MTKISDLSALLGAGVDQATDLLTIVDMSETGAARNKKITVAQLLGLIDVTGLLDFKGSTDCSANPNYPAASKGDYYLVSVAGKIGGASGIVVEAGDTYFATADNAGGTQASVGTSWTVIQGNLTSYLPLSGGTLTGDLIVPDEAYDATAWNGSLEVPTKNAVRDKIESISVGGGIDVEDEGTPEATGATTLNFVGAGVTAADVGGGVVDVTISGGGGGIDVEEDGVSEGTGITSLNFTTGLDVSVTGSEATISASASGGAPWWYSPPLASAFSVISGDATNPTVADDADIGLVLDFGGNSVTGQITRAAVETITSPASAWTYEFKMAPTTYTTNDAWAGFFLRNVANNRNVMIVQSNDMSWFIARRTMTAFGAVAFTICGGEEYVLPALSAAFWKVTYDGSTNVRVYMSSDGKYWRLIHTEPVATYLVAAADRIGFCLGTNGATGITEDLNVSVSRRVKSW